MCIEYTRLFEHRKENVLSSSLSRNRIAVVRVWNFNFAVFALGTGSIDSFLQRRYVDETFIAFDYTV